MGELGPFFTIITRTHKRPGGLRRATNSVLAQTCKDWEQLFIYDPIGIHPEGNVLWANAQFAEHADKTRGKYILALDDDGEYQRRKFLQIVKRKAVAEFLPDCLLVRSISPRKKADGGGYHRLPSDDVWDIEWEMGERPDFWYGHGYNWCCHEDIFKRYVNAYIKPRGGDWHFMTALIRSGIDFVRCDVVGGHSISRGKGVRFENATSDWFDVFKGEYKLQHVKDKVWRLAP